MGANVVETANNKELLKSEDGLELGRSWELNRPGEYFVRLVDVGDLVAEHLGRPRLQPP